MKDPEPNWFEVQAVMMIRCYEPNKFAYNKYLTKVRSSMIEIFARIMNIYVFTNLDIKKYILFTSKTSIYQPLYRLSA